MSLRRGSWRILARHLPGGRQGFLPPTLEGPGGFAWNSAIRRNAAGLSSWAQPAATAFQGKTNSWQPGVGGKELLISCHRKPSSSTAKAVQGLLEEPGSVLRVGHEPQ